MKQITIHIKNRNDEIKAKNVGAGASTTIIAGYYKKWTLDGTTLILEVKEHDKAGAGATR